MQRGFCAINEVAAVPQSSLETSFDQPQMCMAEPIADDDPTTHELERKASVAAWEDVRESFLHVFT